MTFGSADYQNNKCLTKTFFDRLENKKSVTNTIRWNINNHGPLHRYRIIVMSFRILNRNTDAIYGKIVLKKI